MAAGPTPKQLYRAKRTLCIRAEQAAKVEGYAVIRCGAKRVNVFNAGLGILIGSIWPKVLRASNGEACVLLETDSGQLRRLIK